MTTQTCHVVKKCHVLLILKRLIFLSLRRDDLIDTIISGNCHIFTIRQTILLLLKSTHLLQHEVFVLVRLKVSHFICTIINLHCFLTAELMRGIVGRHAVRRLIFLLFSRRYLYICIGYLRQQTVGILLDLHPKFVRKVVRLILTPILICIVRVSLE